MAKFSFFSFDWLNSKERKELETLKREKEREQIKKEVEDEHTQKVIQHMFSGGIQMETSKPFKSVRLIGDTCLVVLNDGTTLSKDVPELLGKVRQAQSEEEIISMFMTKHVEKIEEREEFGRRKLVEENIDVLTDHEDFEIRGTDVYLKGVNLAIPPVVLSSFIELVEKMNWYYASEYEDLSNQYEALKMFWNWTALNPIESARESLLEFVQKNDITITTNGLLLMYRRVVKREGTSNHALIEFISNQYSKVKRWKKSPANYEVYRNFDKPSDIRMGKEVPNMEDTWELLGSLEELYLDLPNMQETSYTDGHTRTKDIRVGHVYREDEDKIDLDRNESCGAGLHVGSRSFGFGSFGDVGVIALVNPMFVRSVPNHECNKMRVSEMFIVAVAELDEYSELVEDGEVLDFSNEYCSESLEELEIMLRDKKIDKISCQEHLPAVSIVDVAKIKEALKQRIVNI